ncbi:MAG: threonine/serine exporter family protein [Negativicutes bacterium]|nr:threonine/serine exporter family protein [Negativicutes bacterium]
MPANLEQALRLAVQAGEIMLRNGAETSRVEETMEHIAKSCGAARAQSFVIPTGVFLTVTDAAGASTTTMRRIHDRTINLDRIAKVNELSRRLADRRLSCEDAGMLLDRIARERTGFSWGPAMAASGVVGASAAVLQDAAGFGEICAAFLAAAIVRYIAHIVTRLKGVRFMFDFCGAMAAALIGQLLDMVWPNLNRDIIIIGAIMPLVPGVAITNAIRDVIAGDLLSGLSRGLEATLTAIAVAMGVAIVLTASLS